MKRVLVSDSLAEEGLQIFREAEGIEVDYRPGLSHEELLECIGDYHGLAVRSGTKVGPDVFERATKLQVVGRAGVGVDNIDVEAASRHGVVVMNTPGGNSVTTAEHTLAMMMAVSRKIPQATASLKAGRWEKSRFKGRELFRKTLGIIGLGNIGRIVADRAKGLKMEVLAYDPFLSEEAARRLGVQLVDLPTLFRRSDYVTVHVPLTEETRGLIDAAAIDAMKKGVFIINCARGGIVDEDALHDALQSGKVAGAAFDVFVEEPPPADHPLLALDNFICTPHLGASTTEAQVNVAVAVAEQMVAFLRSGEVRNALNLPTVSRELLEALGPFIELGRILGRIAGQLGPDHLDALTIEVTGEVQQHPVRPISVAALVGVLAQQLDVPVNEVNAPHLARERGLSLVERSAAESEVFTSLVTVTASSGDREFSVAGTIFGRAEPRIVRFEGFDLEAVPEGTILVIHNYDRPGVVGRIGSVLGAAGVNISRMQLSLDRPKGEALALVNVDSDDPEAIRQLSEIEHVISVRVVKL
ncbi:MAG: phosphoglycerate dehydrogenase [Deltaproteobacteria bacterium]|nr:MAG: phosphoglycerate dehydrogenase [Deltaproteobacteria bacterium]